MFPYIPYVIPDTVHMTCLGGQPHESQHAVSRAEPLHSPVLCRFYQTLICTILFEWVYFSNFSNINL